MYVEYAYHVMTLLTVSLAFSGVTLGPWFYSVEKQCSKGKLAPELKAMLPSDWNRYVGSNCMSEQQSDASTT